jgi:hypothetical protein
LPAFQYFPHYLITGIIFEIKLFSNFVNAPNNSYGPSVICVPQKAVGSLQSADCDTEWLIGINVVTGGVLCAADSSWFFTVS